jgi:hypothetical protein
MYNSGKHFSMNGWKFEPIAKNIWKITKTANSITLQASVPVTNDLPISFPHRWLKASFLHTTAAFAITTDSELDISLTRTQAQVTPPNFAEYLFYVESDVQAYVTKGFEDFYVYESTVYQISVNAATAGELVFPILYVQELEAA